VWASVRHIERFLSPRAKIATCRRLVVGTPASSSASGVPDRRTTSLNICSVIPQRWSARGAAYGHGFRREDRRLKQVGQVQLRRQCAEAVSAAVLSDCEYANRIECMFFAPELASGAVSHRSLAACRLPPLDCWALFPAGVMMTARWRAFANSSCKLCSAARVRTHLI